LDRVKAAWNREKKTSRRFNITRVLKFHSGCFTLIPFKTARSQALIYHFIIMVTSSQGEIKDPAFRGAGIKNNFLDAIFSVCLLP